MNLFRLKIFKFPDSNLRNFLYFNLVFLIEKIFNFLFNLKYFFSSRNIKWF